MNLSIIVPVYNVERYLVRCLESIVSEMCDDYELILVDDGSTDASGMLCDEFAHNHPHSNVVVIHQSNGGLSAARNRGLEIARGAYITFIDSDDYITPHTITENTAFLLAHPEVDMLEYPVEVHAGSADAYMLTFAGETQCTDIFTDWIRREGYTHCYAWNKIYAASVWEEVRFPVGVYFEDGAVMPDIIKRCGCIHYSDRGCYRYIAHSGTITTSYRYVKSRQLFMNNHRLYIEIKDKPALSFESMSLWIRCLNQLTDMGRCVDAVMNDYIPLIKTVDDNRPPYKSLLKAASNVKSRIKILLLSVVGLYTYCRGYRILASSLK